MHTVVLTSKCAFEHPHLRTNSDQVKAAECPGDQYGTAHYQQHKDPLSSITSQRASLPPIPPTPLSHALANKD
eukprot:4667447-Amphidinium_carterae.1